MLQKKPKYPLETYRQFIRDAAPYVSVVIGRKVEPFDATRMSDEQITKMALIIDERVKDLKPPPGENQ